MKYVEVGTIATWRQYFDIMPCYLRVGDTYHQVRTHNVGVEGEICVVTHVDELPALWPYPIDTLVYIKAEGSAARQDTYVTTFSRKSVEYYTPPMFIGLARKVMKEIDLDPASCEIAQRWIQAKSWYGKEQDGLAHDWYGRIWLNPPWGKLNYVSQQKTWSRRLVAQYQAGNVTQAIMLVRAALGAVWFEDLWHEWPVCFPRKLPTFLVDENTPAPSGKAKQGIALFYFGPNFLTFESVFGSVGRVIAPPGGIR